MSFDEEKKLSVTTIIIIINALFFVPYFLRFLPIDVNPYIWLLRNCGLNIYREGVTCINNGAFWQVLTAMFLHGSAWHIIFNMLTLYMFGKYLEKKWGGVQFLIFYLVVGVLANVASTILVMATKSPTCLIGASGAVVGVVLAFSGYCPDARLLLFGFIPLRAKWALLLYIILEFASQVGGVSDGIAHFTHLFGILFAFLYLIIVYKFDPIKNMWFNK